MLQIVIKHLESLFKDLIMSRHTGEYHRESAGGEILL